MMRSVRAPFILLLAVSAAITTTKGTVEIVFPPYLVGYGYAFTAVGVLTSLLAAMQLASRVPVGLTYRAEAARRQLAAWLVVFGITASGFALSGGDAIAIGALTLAHGFAFGSVGTLGLALVIDVTEGRRAGPSMAWYTAAISAGYALGSIIGGSLADTIGLTATLAVSGMLPVAAALAVLALPAVQGAPLAPQRGPGLRGLLAAGARLDGRVWLAAVTVLYINLLWDALDVFFVILAPSVGISLAAVGFLRAVKSGASMLIRIGGAFVLERFDHRRVTTLAVLAAGTAMVLVAMSTSTAVLLPLFVVFGLARGVLRATSAATVAELRNEGRDVGLASGVYNAGLDVGSILGPALGGIVASLVGIPQMFQVVALASLAGWLAVALSTRSTRAAAGLIGLNVIPLGKANVEGQQR